MNVYKNEAAQSEVRLQAGNSYKLCPVPVKSKFIPSIRFGDTHILISAESKKPVLILLHGASGNSTAWFGMLPELIEDFRICMVDIPGQPGLSDVHRPGIKNGEHLHWLEELIDTFGPESVYLAGMSLGAWLALAYTLKHSDKVVATAVISPSGIANPRAGFFLRILPLAFMGKSGMKRIFKLIHGPVPIYPEMLVFGMLVAQSFKPLTETPEVFNDTELSSLQRPLLFIGGKKDVVLNMPGSAKKLNALVPQAQVILREDFGHVLPEEGVEIARFFTSL